jgi:hypothetical protein
MRQTWRHVDRIICFKCLNTSETDCTLANTSRFRSHARRIPDDGRVYPLPPGLGLFPIFDRFDFQQTASWSANDVIIPVYQRELWLGFDGPGWRPDAIKIGTGRINAVSGHKWDEELHAIQLSGQPAAAMA